jgi:hypothetical protein
MNKRIISFLIPIIIAPFFSTAQQKIKVEEVIREMSKGTNVGYEVLIPEVSLREIKSDFTRYIRKNNKSKTQEANAEIFIIGAVNKDISPDPFNIYAKIQYADEGVKITAFFTENDAIYFSEALDKERSIAIKRYLKDFAITQYRDVVKSDLESQERKQKNLEGNLQDLIDSKLRSERLISEAKRKIENNTRDIESLTKQISAKDDEIVKQKSMATTLNGSGTDEEKMSEKDLKNLESEKRKMDKDKESMARDNDKLKMKIEIEQSNIDKSLSQQVEKNKEIEAQKNKVKEVQEKLDNIK